MSEDVKDFLKLFIGGVLIVMCFFLAKKQNQNVTKNDTSTYKTVTSKKEIDKKVVKGFVKVKTVTRYIDSVVIDTIKVQYTDTIPFVFERKGSFKSEDYDLDYTSTHKGFKVSNLSLIDTVSLVSGTKRKWFLGRQYNTVQITHTNKAINSGNIQHIEVVDKKKFYETTAFKVGVGFLGGAILIK